MKPEVAHKRARSRVKQGGCQAVSRKAKEKLHIELELKKLELVEELEEQKVGRLGLLKCLSSAGIVHKQRVHS